MGEWRFYHDWNGCWQWSQLNADGVAEQESTRSFPTLELCLADAQHRGMDPQHTVRFPGKTPRPLERRKAPRK
jgi:hypothetical protein